MTMRADTLQELERDRERYPMLYGTPAVEEIIEEASEQIGMPFPNEYREFLTRFGGAIVGAYPVFGVTPVEELGNRWSVVDINRTYRDDQWPGISEWLIVSADHAGNPIGIVPDGTVWLSDHDFGEIVPIATSFEDFIRSKCLRVAA